MPTFREVNALAQQLGLDKPSARPGPVGSLLGLPLLARVVATAKIGSTLVATREFSEGEYRLEVIGEPQEYEHPWYPGTRVLQCRVRRGRSEGTLSARGSGGTAHLLMDRERGTGKQIVAFAVA